MNIHGYCTECHRPKRVRLNGHQLAKLTLGRAAIGVCDQCRDTDDLLRRAAAKFPLDLSARIDWLETQRDSFDAIQLLRNGRRR